MTLIVSPQDADILRKGLARLIKHKNQNIACIRRNMEADPDNAPANAILSGMIERRERSIAEAERLLAELDAVKVEK